MTSLSNETIVGILTLVATGPASVLYMWQWLVARSRSRPIDVDIELADRLAELSISDLVNDHVGILVPQPDQVFPRYARHLSLEQDQEGRLEPIAKHERASIVVDCCQTVELAEAPTMDDDRRADVAQ